MAGKNLNPRQSSLPELTEANIETVENETISKVNKTITVLEGALATWKASKEKPRDLIEKFVKYEEFHDALIEWETKALRAKGEKETFDKKVQRLREFVEICYSYGG